MKRLLVCACLFLASGTFAAAQEEVPLVPKPPSASQGKMLVIDAVRTARQLDAVEGKIKEVEASVTLNQSAIDAHNAQYPSGQCTYTEANPNACDSWIADAKVLNTAQADLAKQRQKYLFRKAELRAHLNMRLARLRIMALLDGLTEWEREVVACSKIGRDADRGCLITAWEHHP
jgi:hypothetical protein